MNKYDGMNKIDVNVKRSTPVKRRKAPGLTLLRLIIASVLLIVPFSLKAVDSEFSDIALERIKNVVTFDLNKTERPYGRIRFLESFTGVKDALKIAVFIFD